MEPITGKTPYMLLFKGGDWTKGLSAEETQRVTGEWMAWFGRLKDQGIVKSGHPLELHGKEVSSTSGRLVVADRSFAEAKEAIGGYFWVEVDSEDEAVAIAQQCPGLPYGAVVQVRPVADRCALNKAATAELAVASA